MIANIPNAAKALGYTSVEFEELLATALRNGLGCVCLRSIMTKSNDIQEIQHKCNIIEDCNKCPYMRIAVTSKENLVDTLILIDHFERNHEEMAALNMERFENVWMPHWARAISTIELAKAHPSVSRTLLDEAHSMASQIGSATLPPLF